MADSSKPAGKRERTKAQLVDATLAEIEENGLAGASLEAIARRAGMTRGAIYSNFESRADLLLEAAARRALRIDREFAPAENLKAQLRHFAKVLIEALPKARGVGRWHAELQLHSVTDPEMRARVAALFREGFAEMTAKLAAQHPELRIPPRSLVLGIQALAMGFLYQAIISPDEVGEGDVFAAFEALADGADPPRAP
jgi:AcrR family transcriptional regulator